MVFWPNIKKWNFEKHGYEAYKEWTHLVLDRIKRAFPEVDVSFFPDDNLGVFMRNALVALKVKVTYFNH